MSRQQRALGVPLHPLLVHFPIAFWFAVPVLYLLALFAGPEPWRAAALGATIAGASIGAAAIVTGLLEYMQPSLAGIDMRLAARHGMRTVSAWGVFTAKAISAAFLPMSQAVMLLFLALDLAGAALLLQGVYFGTRQVYEQLEKD